jgi:hypothetical protein
MFCLLVTVLCVSCRSTDPFIHGMNDAKKDLANGEFILRIQTGRFGDSASNYNKVLKEDFGIHQEISLGEVKEYDTGYNEVMRNAIQEKHGKDVFVMASEKANAKVPGRPTGTHPNSK